MARLVEQLRQLRDDLEKLINRDPEQEVGGGALSLLDAVVAEAKGQLPPGSTLGASIVDIISVETVEAGEPVRAADALVIVGQLLAVLESGLASEHIEADQRLYDRFLEAWDSSASSTLLLRNHDFGGAFDWEHLVAVRRFCEEWDNAESTFHDDAIEEARSSLLEAAQSLVSTLSYYADREVANGLDYIVPQRYRDDFRLGTEGKYWAEIVDGINTDARYVYELHQKFITTARRRLAR